MSGLRTALLTLLAVVAVAARAQEEAAYVERPDVQAFIRELVARHTFDENELQAVFAHARREDGVLTAMRTQPEVAKALQAQAQREANERHDHYEQLAGLIYPATSDDDNPPDDESSG